MRYIVKVKIHSVGELLVEAESELDIWKERFEVCGITSPLQAEEPMEIVEVVGKA